MLRFPAALSASKYCIYCHFWKALIISISTEKEKEERKRNRFLVAAHVSWYCFGFSKFFWYFVRSIISLWFLFLKLFLFSCLCLSFKDFLFSPVSTITFQDWFLQLFVFDWIVSRHGVIGDDPFCHFYFNITTGHFVWNHEISQPIMWSQLRVFM